MNTKSERTDKKRTTKPGKAGTNGAPGRGRRPPDGRRKVADDIMEGMAELEALMASGAAPESRFTVHTVAMPGAPREYSAAAVRATRNRLGATQVVFARLMGVPPALVRTWEQGSRRPSPLARRLLDEMNHDPRRWMALLRGAGQRRPARPRRRATDVAV